MNLTANIAESRIVELLAAAPSGDDEQPVVAVACESPARNQRLVALRLSLFGSFHGCSAMVLSPSNPRESRARGDRALLIFAGFLTIGFIIAFGARPAVVLSSAGLDDGLFMQLGLDLASGKWLGHYNERTLVKGLGFPAFLALTNLSGLPFPLALAVFHAGCAGFAAAVVRRLTGSMATAVSLLAALLLAPIFSYGELTRVFREFFYMSLTLGFASAAIALANGCFARPRLMAIVTGVLGAWLWLTREEGVWLAPFVLLLAMGLLLNRRKAVEGEQSRHRRIAPAGLAFATAVSLVLCVGLMNWAVYGRFVVNEIKDSAFQSAMSALQDASAPYHREGVPVPAAARARIYAVSPAFATLKEPVLDGPEQAQATQWGCQENRKFCGDFGGGWFMWALRDTAAAHGEHATATKAAAFYRTLARQVKQACADGRLTCEHWRVPLVPPMRAAEIPDVLRSFGKVVNVLTFGESVALATRGSELGAPNVASLLDLLNHPSMTTDATRRRLTGWFVGRGPQWFQLNPGGSAKVLVFTRDPSPDLVNHFNDPSLGHQRFTIEATCPVQAACPVVLNVEGGGAFPLDLSAVHAGSYPLRGGTLYLDQVSGDGRAMTLKARYSRVWLRLTSGLNPLFRGLVVLGGLGFLIASAQALLQRRLSTGLIVCTALLASVVARAAILALIDALSFSAANASYGLAAIPLLLMFSILSLHEAFVGLSRRMGSGTTRV